MRTTTNPFTDPGQVHGPLYATADRIARPTSALHRARVSGRHAAEVIADLMANADGPAAFYKDANPRNFLITPTGTPSTIDFGLLRKVVSPLLIATRGYGSSYLTRSFASCVIMRACSRGGRMAGEMEPKPVPRQERRCPARAS